MSLISKPAFRRTVALCALLAAMPTWATVTTNATVGPMTVQTFDLRPDDGAAPGVSFANAALGASLTATAWEASPFDDLRHTKSASWQGASVDATVAQTAAYAEISGGGPTSPLGASLHLAGSTLSPRAEFSALAAMQTDGQMLGFSLAPWSAMALSFDVSGSLVTVHPGDRAEIVFELSLNTSTGLERFDTFRMECFDYCSDTNGRLLSVTLPNESGTTLDGLWTLTARVAGGSVTSPVPEPSHGALLMSGLAVMGLVSRRRQRR